MNDQPRPRRVELRVTSARLSPETISDLLGAQPDSSRTMGAIQSLTGRPARENTWEIFEEGGSAADVSELIEALYRRALPLSAALGRLKEEGCGIIVGAALYLSPSDEYGAGFAVSAEIIAWMNAIGAEALDVDQYIIES